MNYVIQRSPGAASIIVHVDRLTRHYAGREGASQTLEQSSRDQSELSVEVGTTSSTQSADSSRTLNSESTEPGRLGSTANPSGSALHGSPSRRASVGHSDSVMDSTVGPDLPPRSKRKVKSPARYKDFVRVIKVGRPSSCLSQNPGDSKPQSSTPKGGTVWQQCPNGTEINGVYKRYDLSLIHI